MDNKTNITVSQPTATATPLNMFANQESFNTGYRMAQILSASTIVPKTFQGNIGNTMIAIDMAQRLHTNPLMLMQNIYIVYGMPSFSAKFLIACINASGLFATPLRYEFVGEEGKDTWGCYAYAIDKQGELIKGSTITIDIAKKKGWYQKDGSNWKVEPEQMLRYRAATRFQTAHCPEITCGLAVKEELEDGEYTEITENNVDQLSAEEKLTQAQEKEQKEANTQSLNLNTGSTTSEETQTIPNKPQSQAATVTSSSSKPQPMGKQEMPDMFKQP